MSKRKLEFVKIDSNYINYLREFDLKVSYNQKELKKDSRPFIGVLFEINRKKYYAPLSSANNNKKEKIDLMYERFKNIGISPLDIFFITNRKGKLLSYINLNNMIPVEENNIIRYNIIKDINAQLLINEYKCCSDNKEEIIRKALKLYRIVNTHTNIYIEKRCCNFRLFEEKCEEYNKKQKLIKNSYL